MHELVVSEMDQLRQRTSREIYFFFNEIPLLNRFKSKAHKNVMKDVNHINCITERNHATVPTASENIKILLNIR